jgi:hypothetical protein
MGDAGYESPPAIQLPALIDKMLADFNSIIRNPDAPKGNR